MIVRYASMGSASYPCRTCSLSKYAREASRYRFHMADVYRRSLDCLRNSTIYVCIRGFAVLLLDITNGSISFGYSIGALLSFVGSSIMVLCYMVTASKDIYALLAVLISTLAF